MVVQSLPAHQISEQITRFAENAFKVEQQGENAIVIVTPFTYLYGDPITLHLTRNADEAYILSDMGDTRGWLNEFKGFDPERELAPIDLAFWLTECELYQTKLSKEQHLVIEANPYDIGPAAFRLIQTITHILGLGLADEI